MKIKLFWDVMPA